MRGDWRCALTHSLPTADKSRAPWIQREFLSRAEEGWQRGASGAKVTERLNAWGLEVSALTHSIAWRLDQILEAGE